MLYTAREEQREWKKHNWYCFTWQRMTFHLQWFRWVLCVGGGFLFGFRILCAEVIFSSNRSASFAFKGHSLPRIIHQFMRLDIAFLSHEIEYTTIKYSIWFEWIFSNNFCSDQTKHFDYCCKFWCTFFAFVWFLFFKRNFFLSNRLAYIAP